MEKENLWLSIIYYFGAKMLLKKGKNEQLSKEVSDIQATVNQTAKEFVRDLSKNVFTNVNSASGAAVNTKSSSS